MNTSIKFSLLAHVLLAFALLMSAQLVLAKPTELSAIRLGQTPDQTRVVFEIVNNQRFEVTRLTNPERIVVDFYQAKNAVSFQQQAFQDQRVAGMRVAADDERTRVVLDLRQSYQYRYFTLAKSANRPERLVIDLTTPALAQTTATQSTQIAQAPQPVIPEEQPAKVVEQPTVQVKTPVPTVKPSPAVNVASASVAKNSVVTKTTTTVSPNKVQANQATEALLNNNRDFVAKKEFIVALDAGHGGRDVGAIGPTGVYEKNVTLALAMQMKQVIDQQPGMRAILTRDRDEYVELKQRVDIAKKHKADIFISIHADAFTSQAPRGGSVYVLSSNGASSVMARTLAQRENAALGVLQLAGRDKDVAFVLSDLSREANIRSSRKLGETVLNEMQRTVTIHKHTIQSADFAVLKSIDMPSMLLEAAFISNPHEEKKLQDVRFQRTFAEAVTRGLRNFIDQTGHQPRWGETLYVQYNVQRGDTLSGLAQAYGLSTRELMRINNIQNANQLYVGRKLKVPVTDKLTVQYDVTYKVKRGDTLSQIAQAHKVTVEELMKVNKIQRPNQLYVGRELTIPVREQVLASAH